jgi:hypothetical protein
MTEKDSLTDLITRYETWLKMPFIPTKYYPSEQLWRLQVENKIQELKQKLKLTQ